MIQQSEEVLVKKSLVFKSLFCLDTEFAESAEGAKLFSDNLRALGKKQIAINETALAMEEELLDRIRKHPGFEDHWYQYAAFLFIRGRLDKSEAVLNELLSKDPKNAKALELKQFVNELRQIKDPLKRAEKTEEIAGLLAKRATIDYERAAARASHSQKRAPTSKP